MGAVHPLTQVAAAAGQWDGRKSVLWTDDSNNLFSLLRFR